MYKKLSTVLAAGLVGLYLSGCGASDLVEVEKSDSASTESVEKRLSISEDQSGVIHIKWDLRDKYQYGLIISDKPKDQLQITPRDYRNIVAQGGHSNELIEIACDPVSSTTDAIKYACTYKDKDKPSAWFTVEKGKTYYFRISSIGKDQYGTTKTVYSDPVATLTIDGLKK